MPTSSKRPTVAELQREIEHEKYICEIKLEGRNNQIRSLEERVHELTNKGHVVGLVNVTLPPHGAPITPDNEPVLARCRTCGWIPPVDWDYGTGRWLYETLNKIDQKPTEVRHPRLGIRDRWRHLVGGR